MNIDLVNINDFLKYLHNHEFNKTTITSYKTGLIHFNDYLVRNHKQIDQINNNDIENFFESISIKNNSKNVYRAGIIKFLAYLNKNNGFDIKTIKIERFHREKQQINKISINTINNVFGYLKQENFKSDNRDLVILQLIIKTGIKISDLVRLKKSSWDNDKKHLLDNKLNIAVDEELSTYLTKLVKSSSHNNYLFCSYAKNNLNHNLTVRTIERIVKQYFPNHSYNDLKMAYFKELLKYTPTISKIYSHTTLPINNFSDVL